jgi:glycosyltransferase involved in cell wall biosynthesis
VIVVDDRSTDDSVDVARRHGVRVVVTDVNIGAPAARNLGAELAHGEVLFFLDSDLALAPDTIDNAVRLLQSDPAIGVVCGTYDPEPLIQDSLVERYRSLQLHYWISGNEGDITTIYSALFAMWTKVFHEVGPLNPALRHSENAEYGHRVTRKYRIVLDNSIRGAHDHDDRLRVVLSKFFHRARLHMPLYLRRPDFNGGPAQSSRGWGALAALFSVLTAAVPALLGPVWALVPAGLLAASIASDAGMYRFVRRSEGMAFTCYFTAIHFVVNVTVAVAVFVGAAHCLVSPRFRRTYDAVHPPADAANPSAIGV